MLQESMGESVKVSQNRAALFDMTFLMLVYMVQCFGSSGQLKRVKDDCDTTDISRNPPASSRRGPTVWQSSAM